MGWWDSRHVVYSFVVRTFIKAGLLKPNIALRSLTIGLAVGGISGIVVSRFTEFIKYYVQNFWWCCHLSDLISLDVSRRSDSSALLCWQSGLRFPSLVSQCIAWDDQIGKANTDSRIDDCSRPKQYATIVAMKLTVKELTLCHWTSKNDIPVGIGRLPWRGVTLLPVRCFHKWKYAAPT